MEIFSYLLSDHYSNFEETVKLNLSVDLFWKLKAIFSFFSFILVVALNSLYLFNSDVEINGLFLHDL